MAKETSLRKGYEGEIALRCVFGLGGAVAVAACVVCGVGKAVVVLYAVECWLRVRLRFAVQRRFSRLCDFSGFLKNFDAVVLSEF